MEALTQYQNTCNNTFQIPEYILVDLCRDLNVPFNWEMHETYSRFIINIPEEERQDLIRIFFQIELAHWFYLDFYCQEKDELKPCGIKEFSTQIFKHCPTLIAHSDNVDKILESWREYKMAVPTYGAILLDPSLYHCVLVQGFWARSSWGFPKGKVNEGEAPHDCAIREVLEETGFDIRNLIDVEEYIEFKMHEQLSRLYIVPNVPKDTEFQPRTRKEIKRLEWFEVHNLPLHKKDNNCKQNLGINPNAFFMVIPFMRPLRQWIANRLNRPVEMSDSDVNTGVTGKSSRTLDEYLAHKVPREYRDTRARLVTRQPRTKSRQKQGPSPMTAVGSGQKPVQILKRDHPAGQSKRCLSTDFNNGDKPVHQKGRRCKKAQAWSNFHFNVEEFMQAMFPDLKSQTSNPP